MPADPQAARRHDWLYVRRDEVICTYCGRSRRKTRSGAYLYTAFRTGTLGLQWTRERQGCSRG